MCDRLIITLPANEELNREYTELVDPFFVNSTLLKPWKEYLAVPKAYWPDNHSEAYGI